MKDIQLYQQILGLVAPWQVESVALKPKEREIEVRVTFAETLWACPQCQKRMPEFGADGDRSLYSVNNFLAFPLGHGRYHCVKEAAGRCRGVDLFLERNHVGALIAEEIGEFEEFLGVSGQPGQFGEYKAGDGALAYVREHPARFGVIHYSFPRDTGKVIDLLYRPTIELGIFASALLVMFGAFALCLIFGGNPNPDSHILRCRRGSYWCFHPGFIVADSRF